MLYWDTSAVLSALVQDAHSDQARRWLAANHVHLVSTLTGAEFYAVLGRLERERQFPPVLVSATADAYERGPWRRVTLNPNPALFAPLSRRWPLRGADLWHLALARSLHAEIPELVVLTFDAVLQRAVAGEGLAP